MSKKPILLQVAMEVECQELLKKVANKVEKEIFGYKFYEGTIENYPIVISLSKVGLIETASSLTIALTNYQPLAVINFGIAGATSPNLHVKDIVSGTTCLNINSYRTPSRQEKEGTNSNEWELLTFLSGEPDRLIEQPSSQQLLDLTKKLPTSPAVYYGKIGSGDVWNQEIARILFLNQKYNILCEDMESIATYTICNKRNIPVLTIKMISDNSITGEQYDCNVGIYLQEYIKEYIISLINHYNRPS